MNTRRTQIEIDAAPFVRSHMKQPRGFGGWAFSLEPNPRDVCKDVIFTPAMTYREAKLWIASWFRTQQDVGEAPRDLVSVTFYAQP